MGPAMIAIVAAAQLGAPPAAPSIGFPSAPPPPPTTPPGPPTPTFLDLTASLAPGETRVVEFERGTSVTAELFLAGDTPEVVSAIIPATQVGTFRAGGPVTPIAQVSGLAARSGEVALPEGRLALVCRNPTGLAARFGHGMIRPSDLAASGAIWFGTLEPGERAFVPFQLPQHLACSISLLSGGAEVSILSAPETERARLGAPLVPITGVPLVSDIAVSVPIQTTGNARASYTSNGAEDCTVVLRNAASMRTGVLVMARPFEFGTRPDELEDLPAFDSCRPVLSRSRRFAGTFDGRVLRTNAMFTGAPWELRLECTGLPAGTVPEVQSAFLNADLLRLGNGRAELLASGFAPTLPGQSAVFVRLRTGEDESARYSPWKLAFFVTVDGEAEPPSAPRLDPFFDAGLSNSDGVTGPGPLVFTGTGEAYARVMLLRNGRAIGAPSALVAPNGTWSITYTPPAPGTYVLSARQLDEASNLSERSEPVTVRVTPRPPAPTGVEIPRSDRVAERNGVLVVSPRPTVRGRAGAGTRIAIHVNGHEVGTTGSNAQGRWSFTLPEAISAEESSVIVATARNAAGIESVSSRSIRVIARP